MALFHYMVQYSSHFANVFCSKAVTENNVLFWYSLSQVSKQAKQVLYSEMSK